MESRCRILPPQNFLENIEINFNVDEVESSTRKNLSDDLNNVWVILSNQCSNEVSTRKLSNETGVEEDATIPWKNQTTEETVDEDSDVTLPWNYKQSEEAIREDSDDESTREWSYGDSYVKPINDDFKTEDVTLPWTCRK